MFKNRGKYFQTAALATECQEPGDLCRVQSKDGVEYAHAISNDFSHLGRAAHAI